MTTSVRLPEKTEALIRRLARRSGRTKSEVIREAIELLAETDKSSETRARPYDAIAHLLGCADSGGMRLSERTGEKFKMLLRNRTSRGRRSR